MVGLIIAESNSMLRLGFRSALAGDAGIAIADEATDAVELFRSFMATPHDVILIEIRLLREIGLRALKALRHARPASRLLVHSYDTDVDFAVEALRFGASGFLSNGAEIGELRVAIATVAAGQAYIDAAMGEELATQICFVGCKLEQVDLSGIEWRVARMLAIGVRPKGIAAQLDIDLPAVAMYKARILKKMDRPEMHELLRCAITACRDASVSLAQ